MAAIKVCIEIDEKGQVTVGAEPEEQAEPQETAVAESQGMADAGQDYMRPVKSVDEALQVARDLLANAGQVGAAMEQKDFAAGFKKGPGAPGGYPKGVE